jgi:hypothetical protein
MRGCWKRSTGLLAVLALAACREEEPEDTWKESNRAVLEWSSTSRELVPTMVGGFAPHARQVAFTHVAMQPMPLVVRNPQGRERSFNSFQQMVEDGVLGRIMGGVNFRSSGVVGAESGRQIAAWVTSHSLQPTGH